MIRGVAALCVHAMIHARNKVTRITGQRQGTDDTVPVTFYQPVFRLYPLVEV